MILLLLKFLLVHLLGDFVFQSSKWVEDKQIKTYRSGYLYLHLLVHLILLLIILGDPFKYWLGITITVTSHLIIDLFKLIFHEKLNKRFLFFSDQIAHLIVLIGVVSMYESLNFSFDFFKNPYLFLFLIAVVLITEVSAILMKVLLAKWTVKDDFSKDSLDDAGKYIGVLERLFVFFFIVLGHWQSIGFLLAAKSVFRFGDLSKAKDRKLTEYILIGTLLSFGLAIMIGVLYNYSTKLIHY